MSNHTAQDLLGAVGVDWNRDEWCEQCRACDGEGQYQGNFLYSKVDHLVTCGECDGEGWHYTGPALGTPELDAVLLVEGVRWMREIADGVFDNSRCQRIFWMVHPKSRLSWAGNAVWLLTVCDNPGHALAAAIAEVAG